jgi:hypothetical protein
VEFAARTILYGVALSIVLILLMEVGRRLGLRRQRLDPEGGGAGTGAIEAAIFALLGLLIAFTFSGAASRYDTRRILVGEEANAIGTAWLRVDLLPSAAQGPVRDAFRRYLDSRLKTYELLPDLEAAFRELDRSRKIQDEIWSLSVKACQEAEVSQTTMLLLPALNEMIDITTTRQVATTIHPPIVIFIMLVAVASASALMAGYGMARGKKRSWLHIIGFAAVVAATVYVILDLEYPRLGLITLDAADQVLRDLRATMG